MTEVEAFKQAVLRDIDTFISRVKHPLEPYDDDLDTHRDIVYMIVRVLDNLKEHIKGRPLKVAFINHQNTTENCCSNDTIKPERKQIEKLPMCGHVWETCDDSWHMAKCKFCKATVSMQSDMSHESYIITKKINEIIDHINQEE